VDEDDIFENLGNEAVVSASSKVDTERITVAFSERRAARYISPQLGVVCKRY
jgi:hypothetical protein